MSLKPLSVFIKTLKVEAKKELIRKNAEIKLLEIDIKSAMYADNIDVEAIGKLIDAKYDLKKEKAKNTINKYVELKGILTPEQKDTLKGLKKQCKMMK